MLKKRLVILTKKGFFLQADPFFIPSSMILKSFSFNQLVFQNDYKERISCLLMLLSSLRLRGFAGRQSWGWIKALSGVLDVVRRLPNHDHCPVIWRLLLLLCLSFCYSNFHLFVVSESFCRKANRFLPRENLLDIASIIFSQWISVRMEQLTALVMVPVPAFFHCRNSSAFM